MFSFCFGLICLPYALTVEGLKYMMAWTCFLALWAAKGQSFCFGCLRIVVFVLHFVLAVVMSNLPEHVWFSASVLADAVPFSVWVVCIALLLFGSICCLCH